MSCLKRRGSFWSPGVLLSGGICLENLGGTLMIVWDSQPSLLQLFFPACVTNYLILTDLTQQMFTISQFLWVRNLGATQLCGSGSELLVRFQSSCWLGCCHHPKFGPGLEEPLLRRLISWLLTCCQCLTGYWQEAWVPLPLLPQHDCLFVSLSIFLA